MGRMRQPCQFTELEEIDHAFVIMVRKMLFHDSIELRGPTVISADCREIVDDVSTAKDQYPVVT